MTERWIRILAVAVGLLTAASPLLAAHDVPPPRSCTPQVNRVLGQVIAAGSRRNVDNVMVCGVTVSSSRRQRGGRHGSHEILPLRVNLPDGSERLVEVVTNDDLDGVITAPASTLVFAYGQAFIPNRGHFAAGLHDVHCSTHRAADNGWVIVNGVEYPGTCRF